MFKKYLSRRKILNYGKLSILFLLNSCSNVSKRIKISLQKSFYPDSLKDTLPASWEIENINYEKIEINNNKINLLNSDYILINDGWINSINFQSFLKTDHLITNNNLDSRAKNFLNFFEEYKSNRLFPIGVVPYAVIIKNNKDLIQDAYDSWDFLLLKKLKGKIILPQSPRLVMSISSKINKLNSLEKLKAQVMVYDDKNSLNWLINSKAAIAIIPYTLCLEYLKIDPRLSVVFPNSGVPLMWHFLLYKSETHTQDLVNWIKLLRKFSNVDKLVNQGWFLPFDNEYEQSKFNIKKAKNTLTPSKICWDNSWSLPPISDQQKLNLENLWINS